MTTLADFMADLERQAGVAEAMKASAPVADVLRTVVGGLKTVLGPDGPAPGTAPVTDTWLDVDEVAALLKVERGWIYRHKRDLGFVHLSRKKLRCSRLALERYLARQTQR